MLTEEEKKMRERPMEDMPTHNAAWRARTNLPILLDRLDKMRDELAKAKTLRLAVRNYLATFNRLGVPADVMIADRKAAYENLVRSMETDPC